jgi:hypothetical protein
LEESLRYKIGCHKGTRYDRAKDFAPILTKTGVLTKIGNYEESSFLCGKCCKRQLSPHRGCLILMPGMGIIAEMKSCLKKHFLAIIFLIRQRNESTFTSVELVVISFKSSKKTNT